MLQEVLAIFLVSDGKTNQPRLSTQANLDSYCATEAPNWAGVNTKKHIMEAALESGRLKLSRRDGAALT